MINLFVKNIKGLVQASTKPPLLKQGKDMNVLPVIDNAWLFTEGQNIAAFGRMSEHKRITELLAGKKVKEINAEGKYVIPAYCDSHTHLVYSGSRENEFADKINGMSYEQIAKRGGGILNSSILLNSVSEDELYRESMVRIREIISMGTGAVEIKSGYGLSTESELKMLRVIRRIKNSTNLEVKATFLGAHAIPEEYRNNRTGYMELIINEMIPIVAAEELADYIDVFCDKGFFTTDETERILMAGLKYGLIPKIHANELDFSGGVQTGVKYGALSVDHLERSGDNEIASLKGTGTIPTLLPGSVLFLGLPYPPVRKMIDSGLPVALASDFNPGSSPSGNMNLIVSLACIMLRMTPAEAINAVTINSAFAMGVSDTNGSITPGKNASFFITREIPSVGFLPYSFGSNLIETVVLKGRIEKQ